MRKVFLLLMTVVLLTGCNKQLRQASQLAQEAAMKQLKITEGYKVEETTLDSVFGPQEDTAVMDEAQVLVQLNAMYDDVSQMKKASQSEAESAKYASLLDSIVNTAVDYSIDYMQRLAQPRQFVGFRVKQRYSCTQADSTKQGTVVVYLDKEMTRSTRTFDLPVWETLMRSISATVDASEEVDKSANQK